MFAASKTAGAAAAAVPNYIEDVFSTWLIKPPADYTTYSINNGIDLSTKGGMTWFKARDAAQNNLVYDTARGSSLVAPNALITNSTAGQQTAFFDYVTPNTNGFTVNFAAGGGQLTNSGINYASWTFRKQKKFFDVVTYTGDGTAGQTVAHNLGSFPGAIFVKATSTTGNWGGWVRTGPTAGAGAISLNSTAASAQTLPNSYVGDSTIFYPYWMQDKDTNIGNFNGVTYVAYLFAHNAGGFGLTGTDNVISCGSFTTDGSGNATVNLGYEPQWVLVKPVSTGSWYMADSMRGNAALNGTVITEQILFANLTNAEAGSYGVANPTATGFNALWGPSTTQIYIAIRRGPMKVPTDATKVFAPNSANTAILAGTVLPSAGFPVDLMFFRKQAEAYSTYWNSRLLPDSNLQANATSAEITGYPYGFDSMTAVKKINNDWYNGSPVTFAFWQFRRAPGFFDEVCYTGTGAARTVAHNLGAVPELMIVKDRTTTGAWAVYHNALGNTKVVFLNKTNAQATSSAFWNNTSPTSSVFTIGTDNSVNTSGDNYVAYLFSTCAGVSKVGSYAGTGATQTINCGFTGGARFVLIKRYDSTGSSWSVFDTARGMVSGTDPALRLNSTSAETNADWCFTTATGFQLVTSDADVNGSGSNYIFLAIA